MTRTSSVLLYRFAAIGLLGLALGLSACGRKGPLDAPPGGLSAVPGGSLEEETDQGGEEIKTRGRRVGGIPIIKGPNKPIPLDVLID